MAVADLDAEDGTPGAEVAFHAGFDRAARAAALMSAGFATPVFCDATVVHREDKASPSFLVTAARA